MSTETVVIRPSAAKELDDIEEHLATYASPEVAADFLKAALRAFRLLASQPMMGHALSPPRPRLEDVRIWPLQIHRGYLLFYKPLTTERGVEILHLFYGARDIPRFIDEEF